MSIDQDLEVGDFRLLGKLNETDLGLIRFGDDTDWERHDADELIIVLSGRVELYLEGVDEPSELSKGDVTVVPAGAWHRQEPKPDVSLMFATEASSTTHKPYALGD